ATLLAATCAAASAQGPRRGAGAAPRPSTPQAAKPATGAGAIHYVDGVEALEAGDFARAVDSFTKAIAADDENPDFHQARGVANVLAEQFAAAIADLQRALALRNNNDRESRLWLGAAYDMSGDRDPRPTIPCFTPGGDVTPEYGEIVCHRMAMRYTTSRYQGMAWDRDTRKTTRVSEPIRTGFADAARAYTARHKASVTTGGEAIAARMKGSFD